MPKTEYLSAGLLFLCRIESYPYGRINGSKHGCRGLGHRSHGRMVVIFHHAAPRSGLIRGGRILSEGDGASGHSRRHFGESRGTGSSWAVREAKGPLSRLMQPCNGIRTFPERQTCPGRNTLGSPSVVAHSRLSHRASVYVSRYLGPLRHCGPRANGWHDPCTAHPGKVPAAARNCIWRRKVRMRGSRVFPIVAGALPEDPLRGKWKKTKERIRSRCMPI